VLVLPLLSSIMPLEGFVEKMKQQGVEEF